MSRIRSKNTQPEVAIRRALFSRGLRYRVHVSALPGSPDIVFPGARVAVFVDGDFWHGWRFPAWEHKLSAYWGEKIARNRRRDQRNYRKLRRVGWKVVRIWEHEVRKDAEECARRVESEVHRRVPPNSALTT